MQECGKQAQDAAGQPTQRGERGAEAEARTEEECWGAEGKTEGHGDAAGGMSSILSHVFLFFIEALVVCVCVCDSYLSNILKTFFYLDFSSLCVCVCV